MSYHSPGKRGMGVPGLHLPGKRLISGKFPALRGKPNNILPPLPSTPVISLFSQTLGLISVALDIDETITTGDTILRQVQTSGGSWTSLLNNSSHVIASGEVDFAAFTWQAPSNGTYDIRFAVTRASDSLTSNWSNVLTIIVTDVVAVVNYRIASTGNRRIVSAGNYRKVS